MIFRVEYSEQAAKDLDEIIEYIHDVLSSPQAAESLFYEVMGIVNLLCDNPYMFPLYHDEKLGAAGYHYAVIRNYLMFYMVDDENKTVDIIRIVYGRRSIPEVIEG